MPDTELEAWLTERKAVHSKATEGPWEAGEPEMCGDDRDIPQAAVFAGMRPITWDDHNGEVFKPEDSTAIVDAHNTLPALVAMVEAVLGAHQPVEIEPSDTICGGCSNLLPNGRYMPVVEFPCNELRALEAARKAVSGDAE